MFANQTEHEKHYTKIWYILLAVFALSVVASYLPIPKGAVQFIIFAVALVKTYFVVKHFMHLPMEAGIVICAVMTPFALLVILLGLFWPDFGAAATDIANLK